MPIAAITRRLQAFLQLEAAGGIVLMLSAALAIAIANTPFSEGYEHLLHHDIFQGISPHSLIADGLMAVFFFAVGMELKYEMREGELAGPGQKTLPLIAALGGVITPALIYLAITRAHPELRAGWAIPTATDIAFALGVLKLIGNRVPDSAKAFLLAIAIYDDLAAIVIIALVYSTTLAAIPLAFAALCAGVLFLLNRFNRAPLWAYLLVGAAMWLAFFHGGIHPTVAGVAAGIAIPLRSRNDRTLLHDTLDTLHPYVAFGVMPLFALASAGVAFDNLTFAAALAPLPLGIAAGLVVGKQCGIFGATWFATRFKFVEAPSDMRTLYGIALIAGIGFTMSLFIGQLALGADEQNAIRLGVIAGSVLSAVAGCALLRRNPVMA
ncbi:MAG: Na+/H+ antiporter NhaA [Rickettsiales bacterium]